MKKPTTKSYALRIDGPLVKPLQELKKQNRRSLNAEINAALEAWVAGAQRPVATPEVASATSSTKTLQAEVAPKPARAKKPSKRKTVEEDVKPEADANSEATSELATSSPAAASETNA